MAASTQHLPRLNEMKRPPSFAASAVAALSIVLLFRAEAQQNAAPAPGRAAHLGQVNFQTSCTDEARSTVETAVALLHSFQYEEARHTFTEATKQDPSCAMAYWGRAMSRYEQIWEFPNKGTLQHGLEDVQQAQKFSGVGSGTEAAQTSGKDVTLKTTDRERGYIAAAAAFYRDDPKLTHEQRLHAYSSALDQLRKQFPDDVNAGA